MVKRLKILLLFLGIGALGAGAAACATMTVPEEYEEQGYAITVSYDPNGGLFLGRDGVTIVDMFNPAEYEKDAQGNVQIRLTDPVSKNRPSGSSSESIVLTRSGYFLAGWYKTRNLTVNAQGNPIDESGAELEAREDGTYVLAGTETEGYPAYTYADMWDFETDKLVYNESDGEYSLTLYACWIPYFEFNYYYEENGEWVNYGTTDFDYKTTNQEGSSSADRDTIWIPRWSDGAMEYTHPYQDDSEFSFPSRDNYTFAAAYADAERTQPIEETLVHPGTIDYETGTAIDRVQNVYVDFVEGTRYRIEQAEQLSRHGDADGWYEILADLDFKNGEVTWPALLSTNEFSGKFYSAEGENFTLSNIAVTHSNATSLRGGLFGAIAQGAIVENVSFENVTFDLAYTGARLRDTAFGVFAGFIEEGAQIEGVTLAGAQMRIGAITLGSGYALHLVANGDSSGIELLQDVSLVIYGAQLIDDEYNYTIEFVRDANGDALRPNVQVSNTGEISITFVTTVRTNTAFYEINYREAENA